MTHRADDGNNMGFMNHVRARLGFELTHQGISAASIAWMPADNPTTPPHNAATRRTPPSHTDPFSCNRVLPQKGEHVRLF